MASDFYNRHETVTLARANGLCIVQDTPKGRGVFATSRIATRTTVDVSPVLIFSAEEYEAHGCHTQLKNYTYVWPSPSNVQPTSISSASAVPPLLLTSPPTGSVSATRPEKRPRQALPLGLGALFNHTSRSARLNVGWTRDPIRSIITYTALRDIEKGEELCINYGSGAWLEDAVDEGISSDSEAENNDQASEARKHPLEQVATDIFAE